jgi:hypothetical protein
MRDSDALLTLVGSIIHGDHEYWRILLTKQHDKIPVQSRFTRYLIQVLPSAHYEHRELSSETISNWNKRGIVAAEVDSIRQMREGRETFCTYYYCAEHSSIIQQLA